MTDKLTKNSVINATSAPNAAEQSSVPSGRHKMELLAPAGDLEKLKIAVDYGADAVYFGGKAFGLRAGAGNLTDEEIREGMEYAHARGVKGYMTLNIIAHNQDIRMMSDYIDSLANLPVDAFIVSDPGVIMLIKERIPDAEIHLSTQANTTNYLAARFWIQNGVKRIIAAREMSMEELAELSAQLPEGAETEAFVHGAMCISYSGRCLLSNFLTGKDANKGGCTHPCRWKYALVEEKRPGMFFPVEEDARGTYIMNSKDLCMIEHIPELDRAGVSSLKIEGRMKSIFYIATVVKAYRSAIDSYYADPEGYQFKQEWMEELTKASHRHFYTGFFFGRPGDEGQNFDTSAYIKDYVFLAIVKSYDPETGYAELEQRNRMLKGDIIEVFGPGEGFFTQEIREMFDRDGCEIDAAPHPQQYVKMKMDRPVGHAFMIRRRKNQVDEAVEAARKQ